METYKLEKEIIYGPVRSRRLGKSLGINLSPGDCKMCSFDCVYCHFGRTGKKVCAATETANFPDACMVIQTIENALARSKGLDCVTFSGTGEATLHPDFLEIAEKTHKLRDEILPEVPLAILTNSTTLYNPDIRKAFSNIDCVIAKLDAGDEDTFRAINRPPEDIRLRCVIGGLKSIKKPIIQSLMLDGEIQNIRGEPLRMWMEAVESVAPKEVQIYSTDRPVAEKDVKKVPKEELERIADALEKKTGIPTKHY